jgi:hypothetical protein
MAVLDGPFDLAGKLDDARSANGPRALAKVIAEEQ